MYLEKIHKFSLKFEMRSPFKQPNIFVLITDIGYIFHRLQDLQARISALSTSKDTLERMCHNSRDEIQDIISKLENISLEVKDIQGEQRVQSKMMESRENQLVSSDRVYFNIEYILYLLEKSYLCQYIRK